MNHSLYRHIEQSSAHRPSRDFNASLIFENPDLLKDLMTIALDPTDKYHYKACWILELVLEKNIGWLSPYLDDFCNSLSLYSHDGAIRSVSKIVQFAATFHCNGLQSGAAFLTELQLKKMTEVCFDWLIGDEKVASKAYAMRALFEIGKLQPWIYPELREILENGYAEHSAAYKAATKELLKRMKNH